MRLQCNVDSSKFSEPLPWIGLYVAASSFLCSLLMGLDTFLGFRRRKLWFPSRFFSLNATSLTILSVATILPGDLNTSMPRPQDQLTKLSGTVLICTVMGNFMTSLGTMDGSEILSNVIALVILVVTVIINIGIQMGTGVIYVFFPEHAIIMFLMLVVLVIVCSTAMMLPTAKELLQKKYDEKYNEIQKISDGHEAFDIKKHWIMAHTGSPQYVVGRSVTCTASGAFCLLSALILLQAAVRSLVIGSVAFCEGKSDYTWSITLVLVSQAIAVFVGTIAPAVRWFNAISFRSPKRWTSQSLKGEFTIEKHYVQKLKEWKDSPLPFDIRNRRLRKISHVLKNKILDVIKVMQSAVVIMSKLIRLTSILPVSGLGRLSGFCRRLGKEGKGSRSQSGSNVDLSSYVLHLDGEEELVQLIMTNGYEDKEYWIRRGKKNPPKYLNQLLMKSTISQGFQGVVEFDSIKVPSFSTERPPNCWALPIVTLTSIAIAIAPRNFEKDVKLLQRGVHESLKYARLIEENLDDRRLTNMRKAADIVWLCIDTNHCWLHKDLKKILAFPKGATGILQELAASAEEFVKDYNSGSEKEDDPRDWPAEVLAANSMYRISRTILLKELGDADRMFEWLQKAIADIIGACLTNLPEVISMKAVCSSIESREESVRDAAYLLGETEETRKKLENIGPYPGHREYINSWIANNTEGPGLLPSSSNNNNNNSSCCISISLSTPSSRDPKPGL